MPDWPTTFGRNPFLFPWSGMVGGVLVEHGHRLLGAAIGALTVALGVTLLVGDARRWVRWLGVLAVLLVSVQGLVGGLRVILLRDTLAIVHGCLAQLFLGLLVGLAVVTGPRWRAPGRRAAGRPAARAARGTGGGGRLRAGRPGRLHDSRGGALVARDGCGRDDRCVRGAGPRRAPRRRGGSGARLVGRGSERASWPCSSRWASAPMPSASRISGCRGDRWQPSRCPSRTGPSARCSWDRSSPLPSTSPGVGRSRHGLPVCGRETFVSTEALA